jgi:carbon storage regulator CsrA
MVAMVNRVMDNVGGFLCLSRRESEAIFIDLPDGSRIEIEVGTVHSHRVGLRIRAPRTVRILRSEIADKPQRAA